MTQRKSAPRSFYETVRCLTNDPKVLAAVREAEIETDDARVEAIRESRDWWKSEFEIKDREAERLWLALTSYTSRSREAKPQVSPVVQQCRKCGARRGPIATQTGRCLVCGRRRLWWFFVMLSTAGTARVTGPWRHKR